uniref:Uncharacterized protein n=1 Tax=Arundo donax TaxID=35708 RepID=A0A0A9FHN1_ARUDO
MYPGQTAIRAAAMSPAPESQISRPKAYATSVVLAAKKGAVRTQTSRMWTAKESARRKR